MDSPAASSKPAVCLLSGGLDSATCLAVARREGYRCYALSFDYGQRHRAELQAAARVASSLAAAEHRVVSIDLRAFGGSALTADIAVPKAGLGDGIPVTYVPARNTIFLSLALAWAEVLGADKIVIGVNAIDYSGYPDCRPEFIAAFERLASLATKRGVVSFQTWRRANAYTPIDRRGIDNRLIIMTSDREPVPVARPQRRAPLHKAAGAPSVLPFFSRRATLASSAARNSSNGAPSSINTAAEGVLTGFVPTDNLLVAA